MKELETLQPSPKLAVAFDTNDHNEHDSIKNYFEKELLIIFENLTKLNKGIRMNKQDGDEIMIHIDNKYYETRLRLELINLKAIEDKNSLNKIGNVEGLVIFCDSSCLIGDYKKILNLLDRLTAETSNRPGCIIAAFHEERNYLNNFSQFQNFIEFTIDNHIEIITGIKNFEEVNEDDGIGALNLALQSNVWTNSVKKSSKEENCEEVNFPYEELKEDRLFDDLLEKMNEIRRENMNMNRSLSDEARRKNAENAILMFAKMLKLDECDEEDFEEVEEV